MVHECGNLPFTVNREAEAVFKGGATDQRRDTKGELRRQGKLASQPASHVVVAASIALAQAPGATRPRELGFGLVRARPPRP